MVGHGIRKRKKNKTAMDTMSVDDLSGVFVTIDAAQERFHGMVKAVLPVFSPAHIMTSYKDDLGHSGITGHQHAGLSEKQ